MKIYLTGDSGDYLTTLVKINGVTMSCSCSPSSHRAALEPTIASIAYTMAYSLGIRQRNACDFMKQVEIGTNGFICLVQRQNSKYKLNGMVSSRSVILNALARVIYTSCTKDDGKTLFNKLYACMHIPENVTYALENRAPFHWYENYKKISVSMNIQQISDTECALEISDGIWGTISIKDLNTFLNYYRLGKRRGSWKMLSPASLWGRLMEQPPTESQLSLMIAFLKQNRTQDIVEKRAEVLINDLLKQYPDKLKLVYMDNIPKGLQRNDIIDLKKTRNIYVRGKLADWCLMEGGQKAGYQLVSTYLFTKEENPSKYSKNKAFQDGYWSGPICIDNLTSKVSVGDQFASRAISLMNDSIMVARISTIKRYLSEGHTEGQEEQRVNFDEL
jgi:hypothetical protein